MASTILGAFCSLGRRLQPTAGRSKLGHSKTVPSKLGSGKLGSDADAAKEPIRKSRSRSAGVRITRVGVWYLLGMLVVSAAAINTGNNGLFLTVAAMVAAFLVTGFLASLNVARLELDVSAPGEIYANGLSKLEVRLRGRALPSWLLLLAMRPQSLEPPERRHRRRLPLLVPFLAAGGEVTGQLDLLLQRRGARRLRSLSVSSLFPLGLFNKERLFELDVEILVYPEIYPATALAFSEQGPSGDLSARRTGFGYELHTLRGYQPGDDPRSVHWKQSARHQSLIVQQRQDERSRRLRIVFDNAVGELTDELSVESFERLVSEAASAAVQAIEEGYEVALLTRDGWVDFAAGNRQRRLILETLARVEAQPVDTTPLAPEDSGGLQLRLGASREEILGTAPSPLGRATEEQGP